MARCINSACIGRQVIGKFRKPKFEILALTALATTLVTLAACAESLTDPTQPPAEISRPNAASQEISYGGPILQSVFISPEQKSAIISGQLVVLGGKFGEARVTKISESEVVLQEGKNRQFLSLFPNVDKKPVVESRKKMAGSKKR